jgi:TolB-like protein/tRNA A-37 threonylcarbamoyl transferase component Bud32/Tfp pilus assembly protein PilF
MEYQERLSKALADRYQIQREVGSGGMATVYLAEDLKHRRPVAIKVLRPELSAALGTERFLREIEVVARLNHPNILGLHDSGDADGLLYFVMPFVEGESLRARLERESCLPLEEAVRITREIGDALQYAHEQGLVHRDIKPENILFQAGHALVCDFGIAQAASAAQGRLTRTGVAVGTFTYMSPEQLSDGGVVDRRTDVYALGCLLHEMLSGEAPFLASTPQATLAKKLTGTLTDLTTLRPEVPPTVQEMLERSLEVDASERFPTAEAFTNALELATTAAVVEEDAHRRRRRKTLRTAAAGTGALLIGVGAWWLRVLVGGPTMDRIAVLPLVNEQNDTAQAYLVQGLHQDLVIELAKAGIGVINSASVAQYAGTLRPVREIAAELNVDGIVQGSAGLNGGQVFLELQLVNGGSEEILWVQSFQESSRNLVTLYHEVTRAVAGQIGMRLARAVQAQLGQAQEVDPQVYEALLQARFHYQKLTEAGFETALDYYELAIERDSLSAEAWVGIAQVWGGRAQQGLISGAEANQMAEQALARARELDPSLSGVQRELAGRLVWSDWNWSAGEDAFVRALAADPTDSRTRGTYSHLLLYLNRDEEALRQAEQAAQLDPFNTLVQGVYAMALNSLRRYEEAEAALLPVLAREPQAPIILTTLRTTYHLMGRFEDAMEMWRASYAADPEALEALERGYQTRGYSAALQAVADLFVERSVSTYVRPWLIGTLYMRAGMGDAAIGYLEQAFEEHDPNMPYISTDPIFDIVRQEPRFRALMDRLGLPQSQ